MNEIKEILKKLRLEYNQYVVQCEWSKALKISEKIISLDSSADNHIQRAVVLIELKRYKEALNDLKEALMLEPAKNEEIKQILSNLSHEKKDITKVDLDEVTDIIRYSSSFTVTDITEHKTSPQQNKYKIPSFIDPFFSPGNVINKRYKILEPLGKGGMGVVYKIEHILLQKFFALKVLHPHLKENKNFRKRFIREAKASMEFSHEHALQVRDFGETEQGHQYLVMDFSDGISLKELLAKEKILSEKRSLKIIKQILSAFQNAHVKKIVHRDLKPSNIVIENRFNKDHALVLDFGIAKFLKREALETSSTEEGIIGTPHYMSPEQANGDPVDERTDIYSIGIILFEMVTGELPFQGESPFEILGARILKDPPLARNINPTITPKMERIITKAIDRNRQKRFSTAKEFIEAIDDYFLDSKDIEKSYPALPVDEHIYEKEQALVKSANNSERNESYNTNSIEAVDWNKVYKKTHLFIERYAKFIGWFVVLFAILLYFITLTIFDRRFLSNENFFVKTPLIVGFLFFIRNFSKKSLSHFFLAGLAPISFFLFATSQYKNPIPEMIFISILILFSLGFAINFSLGINYVAPTFYSTALHVVCIMILCVVVYDGFSFKGRSFLKDPDFSAILAIILILSITPVIRVLTSIFQKKELISIDGKEN